MSLPGAYGLLMIGGFAASAWVWSRTTRGRAVPALVFMGGIIGAVLGAKLAYLLAEGWMGWGAPGFWQNLLVGRTILGGLLGGYAGVEWGKAQMRYPAPTGDLFALATPLGIALGRIGCWLQGCCLGRVCEPAWYAMTDAQGHPRLPASLVEAGFNLLFLLVATVLYRLRAFPGQLFHLYLMAYGLFRFGHEFLRDTPRILGPLSPYHILALCVLVLGTWRYWQRRQACPPLLDPPAPII